MSCRRPRTAPAGASIGAAEPCIISAAFDAGNILVDSVADSCELASGDVVVDAKLRLRAEPFTHSTDKRAHLQWHAPPLVSRHGVWHRFFICQEIRVPRVAKWATQLRACML